LLKTSTNATTTFTFTDMSMSGIATPTANSVIEVVGVAPTNDQIVFIKISFVNGADGDAIYRSTNGGASWTQILPTQTSRFGLSFLVRKNGTCIAGTREKGAGVSTNCTSTTGTVTFTELTGAPHIGCLAQDSTGVVWACTQNYASPQLAITSDGYGIMKTTDLITWTGVLRYQDIQAPVACAAGTVQEDQCVQRFENMGSQWCCLTSQLGITATPIDCTGPLGCFYQPDGAPDAGTTVVTPPDEDCCGTGHAKSSGLLSLLVAGALLLRRRRAKAV
jgi:MYXO-CTERM domain-containing protein